MADADGDIFHTLGQLVSERAERITKQWSKEVRASARAFAPEGLELRALTAPFGALVSEMARLLLERGAEAPRLFGEAARHLGGTRYEQGLAIEALVAEFTALGRAVHDEIRWRRLEDRLQLSLSEALVEILGEGAAAAAADFARRQKGGAMRFREAAVMETILAHLDEGIAVVEADGAFSFVTPPFRKMLGLSEEALLAIRPGKTLDAWLTRLDVRDEARRSLPAEDLAWMRALKLGRPVSAQPLSLRIGGAEPVVYETSALPIFDEERRLRGAIVTLRDRTDLARRTAELDQAYRTLKDLYARLLHRTRQQAMSEVALGAAHALNNVLNALSLRVGLLRKERPSSEVAAIDRAVSQLATLVARLQKFATPHAPQAPEAVDVNELTKEALDLLQAELLAKQPAEIRIDVLYDAALPPASASTAELREIIVELLVATRTATAHGGTLFVRTSAPAGRPQLELRHSGGPSPRGHEDDELLVSARGGLGFDLLVSSAREQLARAGGALTLRPQEDGGMAVVIELAPAARPSRGTDRAEKIDDDEGTLSSTMRVLIVDDDQDNRETLAEVLRLYGLETSTAASGRAAIAAWGREVFDAALCDLAMPDMNGLRIARTLREARPEARIALVSGYDPSVPDVEPGEFVFFRKPVDLVELLAFLGARSEAPAPAPQAGP